MYAQISSRSARIYTTRCGSLLGMTTSEPERQAFQTALEAAVRERDELNVLIEHLARRAGVQVPDGVSTEAGGSSPLARPDADPSSLVADGEFYGQSATKASKALLGKLGRTRPLKTPEIYDAVIKGGVKIKDMEVLYKSLARSDDFLRVQKGTWGLAEWYPDRVRKNARKEALEDEGEGDRASAGGQDGFEETPALNDGE